MSDTWAAIDAGNQNFMATFRQQDAAGMASLYTANGQLLPANSDVGERRGWYPSILARGV